MLWAKTQAFGAHLTIIWEDGEITGSPKGLVDEFREFCKSLDGETVGPSMSDKFTVKDHLSSPISVLVLLREFAGPGYQPVTVSDDWPTVDLPSEPGARV